MSFAGGHTLGIAAYDRRVKAVVAQVPAIGLWRYLRQSEHPVREAFLAKALADRLAFVSTGKPRMLAITAPDGTESILGTPGYDWHHDNEQRHATFHNAVTAHSLDRIVSYDPGAFVEDISPTPLLMILAETRHHHPIRRRTCRVLPSRRTQTSRRVRRRTLRRLRERGRPATMHRVGDRLPSHPPGRHRTVLPRIRPLRWLCRAVRRASTIRLTMANRRVEASPQASVAVADDRQVAA